jgi:carbonic anhydrase
MYTYLYLVPQLLNAACSRVCTAGSGQPLVPSCVKCDNINIKRGIITYFNGRKETKETKETKAAMKKDMHNNDASRDEDPELNEMFRANAAWVKQKNIEDPEFFKVQGEGQSPNFLYIGCSDSRVAITNLTGVEMGRMFVHRNIANLVVSADLNLLSVLTYAVEHLQVRHILVCGHYDCGGVRAAMKGQSLGVLDAWLQNIRDVYRLHKDELDAIEDPELRHRHLVELNIVEQCLNLYKTSVVQKKRMETHADDSQPFAYPRIHGLVFDPGTGVLQKLPIDFRDKINEIRHMFDLFEVSDSVKGDHDMVKKEANSSIAVDDLLGGQPSDNTDESSKSCC